MSTRKLHASFYSNNIPFKQFQQLYKAVLQRGRGVAVFRGILCRGCLLESRRCGADGVRGETGSCVALLSQEPPQLQGRTIRRFVREYFPLGGVICEV